MRLLTQDTSFSRSRSDRFYNLTLLEVMLLVVLLLALNDQTAFSAHIIACAVIVVHAFFIIDPFS